MASCVRRMMRVSYDWRYLAVFHFAVPLDSLNPYLPEGYTLDSMGGMPWVGLMGSLVHQPRLFGFTLRREPFVQFHSFCYVKSRKGRGIVWLTTGAQPASWKFVNARVFGGQWKQLECRHSIAFEPGEEGAVANVNYEATQSDGSIHLSITTAGPIGAVEEDPIDAFAMERPHIITTSGKRLSISRPVWFSWKGDKSRVDVQGNPFGNPEFAEWFQQEPVNSFLVKGSAVTIG